MTVTSFLPCQSWCELLSPQPLRLLLLGVSSPKSWGGGHIQWLREAGAWKPGYFTQRGGTLGGQPCRRQCSLGGGSTLSRPASQFFHLFPCTPYPGHRHSSLKKSPHTKIHLSICFQRPQPVAVLLGMVLES